MGAKTLTGRERYLRAAALLNDTSLAAELERVRIGLAATPQPAGRIIGESAQLEQAKRVGLLAGSFNPLTRAHVALAEAARVVGQLDAALWALTVVTVDKERVERASLVDRSLQMLAYVGGGSDGLALLNRGLYVEQVEAARALMPALEELVVVVGFDKIVQILDPRYYNDRDAVLDRLFGGASLLVAPREDESESSLKALMSREENRRFRRRVAFCPLPKRYRGDSSTAARRLASEGAFGPRLRALMPPEGQALAVVTGAYAQRARDEGEADSSPAEAYWLRQAIIAVIAAMEPRQTADAPDLDSLIAARLDPSRRTAVIAEWLERVGLNIGVIGEKRE